MIEWHHEQMRQASCVPACMCIVQKWRGGDPLESHFDVTPANGGYDLSKVCELGLAHPRSLGPDQENELEVHLRYGGVIVAGVAGHPYVAWQRRVHPMLVSKFGRLCEPGMFDGPLHAIVLASWANGKYQILDPWFPSTNQPLAVDPLDFTKFFDGYAIFVDRDAPR